MWRVKYILKLLLLTSLHSFGKDLWKLPLGIPCNATVCQRWAPSHTHRNNTQRDPKNKTQQK